MISFVDIKIVKAQAADEPRWSAYVDGAPDGTFFHMFGWRRVIEKTYGYEPVYLMAIHDDAVVGVLPLIDVDSPLMGRSLVSTAFTVGGGIVADDQMVRLALASAATREGRSRRVNYVELRSERALVKNWLVKDDVYAGFVKHLPLEEEEILKSIPRRRRATVRKGIEAVSEGRLSASFNGDVDVFYDLYAHALRDLGTPIFPVQFVRELVEEFSDKAEILVVESGGEPVLALLSFYFRDTVMPYYFGARSDARAHRAYDYAIWLQMRRGVARGAPVFDFGRSKFGSGSFDYKSFWGFEPQPLQYQYLLINTQKIPNLNPNNPKFSLASTLWKKLPLSTANRLGPMLTRHLP